MIVTLFDIQDTKNFEFSYSFKEEELKMTELLKLDAKITGYIKKNSIDLFDIYINIEGVMVLPCSVTLKPVSYPFTIKVETGLEQIIKEIEENVKKDQNSLDIFPIVWENILLEIPSKIVSEDAKDRCIKGDGWELVTDVKANTPLDKLEDLLK